MVSPRPSLSRAIPWLLVAVAAVVVAAIAAGRGPEPAPTPTPAPSPGPVLAEAPADHVLTEERLGPEAVVDGDTLRLADGRRVRLLVVDTEEVLKTPKDRAEAAADFDAYAARKRGTSPLPVKFGTPAGDAAREALRERFAGSPLARLEVDAPAAPREDGYGRMLAHVVLLDGETPSLLTEELVRAGHSPYFVKYGRSRRYHDALVQAEAEARRAGRGIWSEDGPRHYPDYPERLAWWHARADQVDRWRRLPPTPSRVTLEDEGAETALRGLVGRQATVFGSLQGRRGHGVPRILWLRHRPGSGFGIVFFEDGVWDALDHEAVSRRFVTVTGTVTLYRDHPQIVVTTPEQVSTD